jgi:hypothetical protein
MSVAVSQRLQELRRRLAASENLEVITGIRRAARRFTERTDLREAFAMLVACCDEKRRRIRAASATQRQALAADRASTMSPGIEMQIGAWEIDAEARSRCGPVRACRCRVCIVCLPGHMPLRSCAARAGRQ